MSPNWHLLRRAGALGAAVASSAAMLLVSAGPAEASPPCTTKITITAKFGGYLIDVPATDSGDTHCHLQQGYAGEVVRTLQKSLNCYSGIKVSTDGQFGPATWAAVVTVQEREGINADGGYGPQARDNMYHRHAEWHENPPGCSRHPNWA